MQNRHHQNFDRSNHQNHGSKSRQRDNGQRRDHSMKSHGEETGNNWRDRQNQVRSSKNHNDHRSGHKNERMPPRNQSDDRQDQYNQQRPKLGQKRSFQQRGESDRQDTRASDRRSFAQRPSQSLVSSSPTVEEAQAQLVDVITNQFKMSIGDNAPKMYQYPLRLDKNIFDQDAGCNTLQCSPFEMQRIVSQKQKKIQQLVGKFLTSGFNIWTEKRLEETLMIESSILGKKVVLVIDKQGEFVINTADIQNRDKSTCISMCQILNLIVKEAMSETGMVQLGRSSNFFDHEDPIFPHPDMKIQIWKGFKFSAYKYSDQCNLLLDNCNRFMSTETVLDRIKQIRNDVESQGVSNFHQKFKDACCKEFIGSSVIGNYGNKNMFVVKDIDFDQTPNQSTFKLANGETITIADYYFKTYQIKVTQVDQPLLKVKAQGRIALIPAEFCLKDGVPNEIKDSAQSMRQLLNKVKQTPQEKLQQIVAMTNKLLEVSQWSRWDIQVEENAEVIQSKRLAIPELLHNSGEDARLFVKDQLLKKMPVFNADQLNKTTLILIYNERQVKQNDVENAIKNLTSCQKQIGINSQEIKGQSVPVIGDLENFKNNLKRIVDDHRGINTDVNKSNIANLFFLMVVNRESDYKSIKEVFTDLNVFSQCIRRQTFQKMNMSVASNIMKQINSKLGGESIRIKLPQFMSNSKVMIVGMDVCHGGKNSIVGFVASTNSTCTTYYQDIICQAKGQEIVKEDLDRVYRNALEQFKNVNEVYPNKIIIFRDGVGEAMRQQVIDQEIKQLRMVLGQIFGDSTELIPQITLVVVNKRVNQRMFVKQSGQNANQNAVNPAPGTIIDSIQIENDQGNKCFDFFMVSQLTNQGCATPSHYFVSLNESEDVSREDIENLCFQLCFMYQNWSGSIKVPSVCQLAHKIADYHYSFDKNGAMKEQNKKFDLSLLNYNEKFLNNCYYL